jgi:hypothetical protein
VNTESFVLYKLGKLTTEWLVAQGKPQLVPAFNGYQVGNAQLLQHINTKCQV